MYGFATFALSLVLLVTESAYADYVKAQKYFSRRRYDAAAAYFFQAYSYPKDRAEEHKAEWGLAESLHRMGFHYSSSKYYSKIVRKGYQGSNPFFRKALETLGEINRTISLGQSHIVQLFKVKTPASAIPGPARGFYFHYLGIEAFNRKKYDDAYRYFDRVPSGSDYKPKAVFHLGVVSSIQGQMGKAISYFDNVRTIALRRQDAWLREQASLNIARVHYEAKRYRQALRYYAEIPRSSESWLQALFEASWTFFLMHKHNNVLGNIHTLHSPYFENRFFPESYILRSITFLRLCRIDQSRDSLAAFKERYSPVYSDLRQIFNRYRGDPQGFYRLIYNYRNGTLSRYKKAWAILDFLSRADAFKEARMTMRFADRELARLSRMTSRWAGVGLLDELRDFLSKKKAAAVTDAGRRLFRQALSVRDYLKDLSEQSRLINLELQLKKVDILRQKLNVGTAERKVEFIGGLQPLKLGQDLEYWPFEGEYWEDELGGYVYNIDSKCRKDK